MTSLPGSLSCEDLIAFDVVPSLLAAARSAGLRELLPLQEQAVFAGLLSLPIGNLPREDLLFVADAGAGKKTVTELAAAHHAHAGHRALIVTHDRESAQRCADRLGQYACLGIRSGLLAEAADIESLDLAVAPLDVAALLLASELPEKIGLGLVVFEQLELVTDGADSELWPLVLLRCQALRAVLPLRLFLLCGDIALGDKLASVIRATVVRAARAVAIEEETPSLLRARALQQLRGGILARREIAVAAVHAVRPR